MDGSEGYDSFSFIFTYLYSLMTQRTYYQIGVFLDEADEGYNLFVCEHLYEIQQDMLLR